MFYNQLLIFILGFLCGGILLAIIAWLVYLKNNKKNQYNDIDFSSILQKIDSLENSLEYRASERHGESKNIMQTIMTVSGDTRSDVKILGNTLTKGTSTIQGNWGQTICENILKEIGFKKGREYESQKIYLNENDEEKIPDFVIHLPQDRDYIIDSKVSLSDWADYVNSTDENLKDKALKRHIACVIRHIKSLSEAGYSNLKDLNTGEFIIMFMPVENSFQILSEEGKKINEEAFKNNITIVGPSLLHLALRIVEQMWAVDKQAKNTKEAMRIATSLYNKADSINNSFEDVIKTFNSAQSKIHITSRLISSGQGNFLSLANKFKEKLGLVTTKQIKNNEKEDTKSN